MDTTILQIPVSKTLRNRAAKAATSQGFSSLQEAVRIFLNQLSTHAIRISFKSQHVPLSSKAIKRYNRMIDEVESSKAKTVSFTDVDKMMEYLNSAK